MKQERSRSRTEAFVQKHLKGDTSNRIYGRKKENESEVTDKGHEPLYIKKQKQIV